MARCHRAWGRLPAAMPHAEQGLDLVEQPVAVVASDSIRQRGEVLDVPDQMRPTQLQPHVGVAQKLPIGRKVVAADDAVKRLAKVLLQHLRAPRGVDVEPSETVFARHVETPTPQAAAAFVVPGLVDSHVRLPRQGVLQLLVGKLERRADLPHRLHHLPVADRQAKHVAEKSADRLDRHVTGPFLIGHQRRQPRPEQSAAPHLGRQRSRHNLAGAEVFIQPGAMLGDRARLLCQFDLLDDAKLVERPPSRRHFLPLVVPSCVNLLRRKCRPSVAGMPQLAAGASLAPFAAALWRAWRLDDVAAGRLRGGRRVLLQLGDFGLQPFVFGLQLRDPHLQRSDRFLDQPTYIFFRKPSRHGILITDQPPWRNTNFSRKP